MAAMWEGIGKVTEEAPAVRNSGIHTTDGKFLLHQSNPSHRQKLPRMSMLGTCAEIVRRNKRGQSPTLLSLHLSLYDLSRFVPAKRPARACHLSHKSKGLATSWQDPLSTYIPAGVYNFKTRPTTDARRRHHLHYSASGALSARSAGYRHIHSRPVCILRRRRRHGILAGLPPSFARPLVFGKFPQRHRKTRLHQ